MLLSRHGKPLELSETCRLVSRSEPFVESIRLGNTGLKVSRLCFGTMGVGSSNWRPWVLDYKAAKPLLKHCLDRGIYFFDLADWYSAGEGERIAGKVLLESVPRDKLVLTTKAHYAMSDDPNDQGLSRKHLIAAIDNSLRRLGTDYVDVFMVHAWDAGTPVEETMSTLNDIVHAGKARYIGASTMYAWQFAHMNHVAIENGWLPFCNMQLQYNLLYREEEREMIPYCEHQDIAITSFSPLARGWLSGMRNELRAGCDTYYNRNYGDEVDLRIIAKAADIAESRSTSMAEVAIAWVLSKKAISAPIISAPTIEQLEKNISALDIELTNDEIVALDSLYHPRDVINDYVTELTPRYQLVESR